MNTHAKLMRFLQEDLLPPSPVVRRLDFGGLSICYDEKKGLLSFPISDVKVGIDTFEAANLGIRQKGTTIEELLEELTRTQREKNVLIRRFFSLGGDQRLSSQRPFNEHPMFSVVDHYSHSRDAVAPLEDFMRFIISATIDCLRDDNNDLRQMIAKQFQAYQPESEQSPANSTLPPPEEPHVGRRQSI